MQRDEDSTEALVKEPRDGWWTVCCVALGTLRSQGVRRADRRELNTDLTPIPELLFLVAAGAYKVGFLVGGSPHAITVGTVCLTLSVVGLVVPRLHALLSRRRRR